MPWPPRGLRVGDLRVELGRQESFVCGVNRCPRHNYFKSLVTSYYFQKLLLPNKNNQKFFTPNFINILLHFWGLFFFFLFFLVPPPFFLLALLFLFLRGVNGDILVR